MKHTREADAWDARAANFDLAALEREAKFVAEEPLWTWAMSVVERSTPKRLLDVGCGRGGTTLVLADGERTVVGTDVSFRSLEAARHLTGSVARPPGFACATLEALPFADDAFDFVAGRFVLHHAESLSATGEEIHRILSPGGRAVFVETWGMNPVLRFGRDVAELFEVGLGTPDERPLRDADVDTLSQWFDVEVVYPHFTALELLNRLFRRGHGLARRSPFIRDRLAWAWSTAIAGDRWIERNLAAARRYGWFVGLILTKR